MASGGFIRIAVIALMLTLAAPARALSTWHRMLDNTPFEHFNKDDLALFGAASRQLLDKTPDGQTVSWQNVATGRRGDMTVVRSFVWKGRPCRQVRLTNEANREKAVNLVYACKAEDKWKLVSQSQIDGGRASR